jgi:endo-1,4-beta-xylanase
MTDQDPSRREMIIGGVAVTALACATPLLSMRPHRPLVVTDGPSLRERAAAKNLLVGSAVRAATLAADPQLQAILREDANILVPENELKWAAIQPRPDGTFDFAAAESIYDFATENDMAMRGHCLTWYRAEPGWAVETIPTLSPGKAGDLLVDYVTHVVRHWRGRIAQWDVVNEPVSANRQLTEKLFSAKLGEDYIDLAFKAAAAADPTTLLMLNQDLIAQQWWYEERQRDATLRLLERLMARGVPIQGFGFEAHLETAYGFSETKWRRFLDEVSGMGLATMITEFDVNDAGTQGSIDSRDAAAVALTTDVLDVTLSYPNCRGLLTWGMVDKYHWLRQDPTKRRTDGSPQRGALRDDDYRRKPLWQAVADCIDRAPVR